MIRVGHLRGKRKEGRKTERRSWRKKRVVRLCRKEKDVDNRESEWMRRDI